jgi:hypothetical protein
MANRQGVEDGSGWGGLTYSTPEEKEIERLTKRVKALTEERDAYILKQTVWEGANDELRSTDIALRGALRKIVETAGATSHHANYLIVHRQLIGEASALLRPASQNTSKGDA